MNRTVSVANGITSMKLLPTIRTMRSGRNAIAALGLCLGLASLLAALNVSAASIAYWRFEAANPGADSSGNNNELVLLGATTSPDKAANAPGTSSLVFDGVSASAQTASPLNLSTYTNITVEWFMKTTQSTIGMVMEHSANMNAARGGFYADVNEDGVGIWATVNSGQTGNAGKMTPFDNQGGWHHYAFTIDTALTSSNRLQIYLDGVRVTNLVARHLFDASANTPLLDDIFYLGARNSAQFFFGGSIDELRISDQILTPDQFLSPVTHPEAIITIVQQPADTTVLQNRSASFSASATIANAPESALAYQWQKQAAGSSTWADIPGAKAATLNLPAVALADTGSSYRLKAFVPGGPSTFSSAAVLTVTADTQAPQIVSVGSLEGQVVGVLFDEPLDPTSAAAAGNYSLGGGVTVSGATLQPNGSSVALQTSGLSGQSFTLTVNGVKDLVGNAVSATVSGTVLGMTAIDIGGPLEAGSSVCYGPGAIDVLAGGYDIGGEFDSYHFTYQQKTGNFDVNCRVESFGASQMWALGQLMVRETLDDNSRFVSVTVYPSQPRWAGYSRMEAGRAPVFLSGASSVNWPANSAYPNIWLRVRRTGDTFTLYGGTNGVDWIQVGDSYTPDPPYPSAISFGLATTSSGDRFGGPMVLVKYRDYGNTALAAPRILQSPVGGSRIVGGSFQFGVTVGGTDPFTFQWQKDGQDIPGAVGNTLVLSNLQLTDSGAYRVVVRNAAGDATSDAAQLTVSSDTTPPQVLSAYHTVDGSQIVILFDEKLDAASANAAGNYRTSAGTVSAAALQADERTVILSVSGLTQTGFSLTISNVKDLPGNALSGVTITVDAGLRGHYEFEGNAKDSSPRANDATEIGSPTYAPGQIGQALVVNGVDQRADAGDPGLAGAVPKSISVWFNQAAQANRGVVSFGNHSLAATGGGLFEVLLWNGVFGGHLSGANFDTVTLAGAPPYRVGAWEFGVMTYDGTTVRTYVNGQLGNELALPLNTVPDMLRLGSGAVDPVFTAYAYFNGMIDDVGIWNRALSATEVQALYNGGLAGKNLNLGLAPVVSVKVSVALSTEGITVSWPEAAGDFVLESTGALPGTSWTAVAATPQTEGGMKKVVVQPTGAAQFYRLRK